MPENAENTAENNVLPASRSALQAGSAFCVVTVLTAAALFGAGITYDFYYASYVNRTLHYMGINASEVMRGYRWNKEINTEKMLKLGVMKQRFCKDSSCKNLKYPFLSIKIIADESGRHLYADVTEDSAKVCTYLLSYNFAGAVSEAYVDVTRESELTREKIGNFVLPADKDKIDNACRINMGEHLIFSYKFNLD